MRALFFFAIVGLITNRGVDLLRTALDKNDRIPKSWWLLASWGLGVLLAFIACSNDATTALIGLPTDMSCVDVVLVGAGLGSSAGFWHELLSALSVRSGVAATPKGLLPGPPPPGA